MPELSFILDDLTAATEFVRSLNRKIVRQRFSASGTWNPDRVVLAVSSGQIVAMADCVISDDGRAANGSLLAHPNSGAYAVTALLHLKQLVSVECWQSTLRVPTPATISISRRYFDETFDQAAWEISNELMRLHGPQHHLQPVPIVASASLLRTYAIPPLHRLDAASRSQLLAAAANPAVAAIRTPAGHVLDSRGLMAVAFELSNLPMQARQHVSRLMLLGTAAAHGHTCDMRLFQKLVRPDAMATFAEGVRLAHASDNQVGGIFTFEPRQRDLVASFLEKVATKSLPSALT
ncbi:hypothetical protein FJ960_19895 [Mesorhizobium sp. B2-3-11]|uniref:hypothetical protein n=1 Tax=Mesorhizobium sp. B2-3-11 TaxID=2589953 RepID=UPI00112BD788|nr:hypothetical protein [Mesorhizobium sp. B2-3-11]TPM00140.1 hypothetical protein FJ960_19895 [Mesorhizobium sp. B2-3-11]